MVSHNTHQGSRAGFIDGYGRFRATIATATVVTNGTMHPDTDAPDHSVFPQARTGMALDTGG